MFHILDSFSPEYFMKYCEELQNYRADMWQCKNSEQISKERRRE